MKDLRVSLNPKPYPNPKITQSALWNVFYGHDHRKVGDIRFSADLVYINHHILHSAYYICPMHKVSSNACGIISLVKFPNWCILLFIHGGQTLTSIVVNCLHKIINRYVSNMEIIPFPV